VAGGNLTRSPGPLVLDVTLLGTAKRRRVMTRAGARPGDDLYLSGAIGAAAAGLQALQRPAEPDRAALAAADDIEPCIRRFLYPEPRVRLGLLLGRNRAASACIDLSDGLADGVRRIAEASGVGAVVDAAAVPIEPGALAVFGPPTDPLHEAIVRGDDYELLFTVRPSCRARLRAAARHSDVRLTRIGVCTEGRDLVLRGADFVETPLPEGYTHFR
jgi:thiamine-monophosphate kinase